MWASAHTVSLQGAFGHVIDVQVDVSQGQIATNLVGRPDASIGSRLIRSYSAITCAPNSKTKAPISTLNSTAIAVVREP